MSADHAHLGLGAPITSFSQDPDRSRLRDHAQPTIRTDDPGSISGPTDMSTALLQGASEERIKIEQQIEVGKALSADLQKGATVHVSPPPPIPPSVLLSLVTDHTRLVRSYARI